MFSLILLLTDNLVAICEVYILETKDRTGTYSYKNNLSNTKLSFNSDTVAFPPALKKEFEVVANDPSTLLPLRPRPSHAQDSLISLALGPPPRCVRRLAFSRRKGPVPDPVSGKPIDVPI